MFVRKNKSKLYREGGRNAADDAAFVASSRTDVPKLEKALRRAMLSLEVTHCDAALSDMAAILEEKEA